jgi:hypothetical protein
MTRWKLGWLASSEHKAHGKIAGLVAQPLITPLDYDTVDISSKKENLLA